MFKTHYTYKHSYAMDVDCSIQSALLLAGSYSLSIGVGLVNERSTMTLVKLTETPT
jgi:hypothetical protein